ncbi:hypothetical protein [Mesoaciditoga lauensis]|uniref:hypothetical protein n=1 Tax=Mesoaciditoga lauensis TaxID=1495039 RepID=UPI000564D8A0|nr:hypothetical protein [Mesoaciditoga lauensis]
MRKFFGFLFFLGGGAALSWIYLVKANFISPLPALSFVFQTHTNLMISILVSFGILLIGLLLMGRVLSGVMFILIGIAGIIFPLLTKFGVFPLPNGRVFIWLLHDNFYVTVLVSFGILVIGLLMVTGGKKIIFKGGTTSKSSSTPSAGGGSGNIVINVTQSGNKNSNKSR